MIEPTKQELIAVNDDGFNALYRDLIRHLALNGTLRSSRNLQYLEQPEPSALVITPLTDSEVTIAARKLNYAFGVVERLGYISGRGLNPRLLVRYNRNYAKFLEHHDTLDLNAYGPRLAGQLWPTAQLLLKDPQSRQAVITIFNHHDDRRGDRANVPCTLSLTFQVRDGKLNVHSYMRSNDIWWGLPYDVPAFALIGQMMAGWIDHEPGMLYHRATSLHLYSHQIDHAQIATGDYEPGRQLPGVAIPPAWDTACSYVDTMNLIEDFWDLEERLRLNAPMLVDRQLGHITSSEYLSWCYNRLAEHWIRQRAKRPMGSR